jgi:hypothetical protein
MRLLFCLLWVVIALPCFAFPSDVAYVSGVVTDSVSGSPIDGALVSAIGDQAQEPVVTGVRGTFTLDLREGIGPGSLITVRVQKKGYHTYEDQVGVAPKLSLTIQLVPLKMPKQPSTKKQVPLKFKDAPEFTTLRKQVITRDITAMHDYFVSVDVPTPSTLPPLTVKRGMGSFTPEPQYRGELEIPRSAVNDRKTATFQYANYVMQKAVPDKEGEFYKFDAPEYASHEILRIMICSGLRDYFEASFWKETAPSEDPLTQILWKIRAALGKNFADKLASYVLRIMADTPQDLLDPDMKMSFAKALRIADGILEANMQSWPTIQTIVDHSKMNSMFIIKRGNAVITPPRD